jgi:osmoprotectant transport system ATP-binding protein
VIVLEDLRKHFPGAPAPAVDGISLTVRRAEICVLIGPSGCGKTTTMRMINRMIEPDGGRIVVDGRDIASVDPVELRRGIGYVIQQVGLFPHQTLAENIATVPRLLRWPAARIASRVDELLALVHMDPARDRNRYPRELSGGQKQRVGVARALAADPPLLLMDEPFGALDPLTRTALQDEFLRLLRELSKTIVFVTHDIDEALKLGTRIAVLRAGRLLQYDTPARLLARPVDAFVESFVGADRALKRLGLLTAGAHARALPLAADARRIAADTPLRDALALLMEREGPLAVVDAHGTPQGALTLEVIRAALVAPLPAEGSPA